MPYSYTLLSGDGSNTVFSFSFPYLDISHIGVKVGGVSAPFTWLTTSSIKTDTAPALGAVIEIRRTTPKDEIIVNFTDGSTLLEADLDLLALFDLYCAQESADGVEQSITQNSVGIWDGGGRSTTNFADATGPTGLITKGQLEGSYKPAIDASVVAAAASATAAATSASQSQGYAALADSHADEAAALLALFRGQYLGAQASPPTVDGNGAPVTSGDLYFDTNSPPSMRVYTGSTWINAGSVIQSTVNKPAAPIIASAGQTSVTVPGGYDPTFITVFVNGIKLDVPDINTTSGTNIVFSPALAANDEVSWVAYSAFNVANAIPAPGSVTLDKLAASLATGLEIVVNSIAALRAIDKTKWSKATALGYYSPGDGGNGSFFLDSADTTSADNKGTIIVATDGGRWKLVQSGRVSILQFGAKPDWNGTTGTDNTAAIQAALDTVKQPIVPIGAFKIASPLDFKGNFYGLIGVSQASSTIVYTGTVSAIRNPSSSTTTMLWCRLENLQISAPSIGVGTIIDWKSIQFGRIINVWALGQSTLGCTALNLAATWATTECTYNLISGCYFGLCSIGISIGDGANSNYIEANRFQPSVATGIGILLSGTAAGRVSNITIIGNGFEYPGAINTGINVLQNVDGVVIEGNRFEYLLNGIVVGGTSTKNVRATYPDNYFSSCTTNINLSGTKGAAYAIRAACSAIGTGSSVVGNPFNLNYARTGTGAYTFTFVDAMPDTGYTVNISALSNQIVLSSKSTSAFTVNTYNSSAVPVDAGIVDVSVFHNR